MDQNNQGGANLIGESRIGVPVRRFLFETTTELLSSSPESNEINNVAPPSAASPPPEPPSAASPEPEVPANATFSEQEPAAEPDADRTYWTWTPRDKHNLFLILKDEPALFFKPTALFHKVQSRNSGITIPPGKTAHHFQTKLKSLREQLIAGAKAYYEALDGKDWSDGSDAFDLACDQVSMLRTWIGKYECPKLAFLIAHRAWREQYSKKLRKEESTDVQAMLDMGDRHLDDGLGGKRGTISRSDRRDHHARLHHEASAKSHMKGHIIGKYKTLESSECDRAIAAKLKRRDECSARLEAKHRLQSSRSLPDLTSDDELDHSDDGRHDILKERASVAENLRRLRQGTPTNRRTNFTSASGLTMSDFKSQRLSSSSSSSDLESNWSHIENKTENQTNSALKKEMDTRFNAMQSEMNSKLDAIMRVLTANNQ